jgi:hypothetical protein
MTVSKIPTVKENRVSACEYVMIVTREIQQTESNSLTLSSSEGTNHHTTRDKTDSAELDKSNFLGNI